MSEKQKKRVNMYELLGSSGISPIYVKIPIFTYSGPYIFWYQKFSTMKKSFQMLSNIRYLSKKSIYQWKFLCSQVVT